MTDAVNPLLPTVADTLWSSTVVVLLALLVTSLISLARAVRLLPASEFALWAILAVLVPLFGPIAWMAVGRPRATRRKTTAS
ncbi:hypothetical protein GCM10022219_07430 [Microbacterium oryzae]|uniref:Uncharacterized protein n=1 Tax=Microbacterium oryzae TaxID=743009 RepID=A0A6I6DPM1_9MICO|nr:hypothetical protein [Microbacterium oryzae]QGU26832.1 hypothetical protein D7D94_03495 [Microbacterium oryzae]